MAEPTQMSKNWWVNKTWDACIIKGSLAINRTKHLYMLQHGWILNTIYMEDDNHKMPWVAWCITCNVQKMPV